MRKSSFLVLMLIIAIMFCSCAGVFGHEKYSDIKDYSKIFDLSEIRYSEALEMFPKDVDSLDIKKFYFEWNLGAVGSAEVQFLLSVTYDDVNLQEELSRIQSLANGNIVYDTESFKYDAYVLMLGYNNTSYYALVDDNTIHYMLLQIVDAEDINFSATLLPKGYDGLGEIKDISYNVYE